MTTLETVRPALVDLLARVGQAAPERDHPGADLTSEITWIHQAGLLADALPCALTGVRAWSDSSLATTGLLRKVGQASLPVGRLFEGHVNAAQLIGLYGSPALKSHTLGVVRDGGLLGVWGADGADPVRAETIDAGFVLRGGKAFCSGLGLVAIALISAQLDGQTSLFAVDVLDRQRTDHRQWQVSGMRATRSGGYDFHGVELPADALLGGADDYFKEPYFLGGMYRMCAVQLGGLDALLRAMIASLRRRGKTVNPLVQYRVGVVAGLVSTAAALTERLARMIEETHDPAEIAREAILAREGVERCVVQALEIIERTLGTEAHREATTISLIRRDLSFYIRQAAVDERLAMVGAFHLSSTPPSHD